MGIGIPKPSLDGLRRPEDVVFPLSLFHYLCWTHTRIFYIYLHFPSIHTPMGLACMVPLTFTVNLAIETYLGHIYFQSQHDRLRCYYTDTCQ